MMLKATLFFLICSLIPTAWAANQNYIPHFTFKNGWETSLTLSNMSGGSTEITLTAWSDDGQSFGNKTLVLEGYEGKVISLRDHFENLDEARGWLSLESADQVKGLMTFGFTSTGGSTSLPIMGETGESMVLPLLENNENQASGLAVVNPGDGMTPVEFRLVDLDSGEARSVNRELEGKSKVTFMVRDLFDGPIPSRARMEVYALEKLTGFALTFANENRTVVAVPPSHWDAGVQPLVRRYMADIMEDELAGAVLGVQKGDGPLIAAAAGWAEQDVEAMTPVHASQLGSVTKTMVATLTLMLHDEGLIDIQSPLSTWFPNFPRATRITLRHLLNHSSGIPDYLTIPYYLSIRDAGGQYVWSDQELLNFALAEDVLFEPGATGSYSNTNYLLLAMMIEQVTGQTLAQQLRTRIFDPLGMGHTYLRGFETPSFPVARGYLLDPDHDYYNQTLTDTSDIIHGSTSLGDGGVGSTVEDLITFARALFKGSLLQEETLADMKTPFSDDWDYGLGLQVFNLNGAPVYGHTGSFVWGNAFLFYMPEEDAYVAGTRNLISLDDTDEIEQEIMTLGFAAILNDLNASFKMSVNHPFPLPQ